MMGSEYRYKRFNDAGWGVELTAPFTLCTGELTEEVFIYLPQHITGMPRIRAKADGGNKVNQLTQALMIFHDPKRWFKQNWLGVVIVGGVAAIAFGVGTTAVNTGLAILAKAVL